MFVDTTMFLCHNGSIPKEMIPERNRLVTRQTSAKKNKEDILLKKITAIFLALMLCFSLAACAGGDEGSGGSDGDYGPATIRIGIPNPGAGPIASFGIGTPWAEQLAVDKVNAEGGIYIEEYDRYIPIELFIVDTESNPVKASELTQRLIEQDEVHMLIARHTPDTALPVSAMGERYGVPTVSLECPVDPWLEGGPYEWVYHSFWMIESNYDLFTAMWDELGFGPGSGATIGYLFPNDPDGLAWEAIFTRRLTADGYKISDPGRYPIITDDWTAIINQFKSDGVDILTGCDIPPHFGMFVTQAAQQGLTYELMTMGRAYLFPADANSVPVELADGLTCEVWWTPWHPFRSSLDGMTCQELADAYESEFGIEWSPPMGYKYAGVEIAVDALRRAASLDPAKIRDAIAATNLDTMVGPIKYDPVTHVAETPLVGGQWVKNAAGDAVELRIVYNANNPHIPKNAELFLPGR